MSETYTVVIRRYAHHHATYATVLKDGQACITGTLDECVEWIIKEMEDELI